MTISSNYDVQNAGRIYDDSSIKHIDGLEHVRLRPGMYIGKLGDGNSADDGIYVLIKEVIDNSIDEFRMGIGSTIDIRLEDHTLTVRDYGSGIPQGVMIDAVSIMNTSGKFDTDSYQKSHKSLPDDTTLRIEWGRCKGSQRTVIGIFSLVVP